MISPTCYDISSWMPRDSRAVTLMLVHQGRRDLTIPFTQVTWVASAKVLDMFGVCLNLAIARMICRDSSNSAYSWTMRPPYTLRAQGVLPVIVKDTSHLHIGDHIPNAATKAGALTLSLHIDQAMVVLK